MHAIFAIILTLAMGPHSLRQWLKHWEALEPPMYNRKILVLGDSTNSKAGAAFVPYYERMLYALPSGSPILGVGLSISSGNTTPTTLNTGSNGARMTAFSTKGPDTAIPAGSTLGFVPPGYRMGDGPAIGSGLTTYANLYSTGIVNDASISPQGESWITGGNIKVGYGLVRGQVDNEWIEKVSLRSITDHGGANGLNAWSQTIIGDQTITSDSDGCIRIEALYTEPSDSRIGIRLDPAADPSPGNQAGTIGKAVTIMACWVWDVDQESNNAAYAVDSISIGGWAASNAAAKLNAASYAAYVGGMPFTPDTFVIWHGQNTGGGEWTGSAWTSALDDHYATIIEDVRAGFTAAGKPLPKIVLTVPPQMSGTYEGSRFDLLRAALATIAAENDCVVMDLWSLIGDSLDQIDAGYSHDGDHPTEAGADFVNSYFWPALEAATAESEESHGIRSFNIRDFSVR
tara:strand:+ start:391312 stop:392685 length:1374 start_codon:yes stop_codon:yes gene_type:complete